MMMIMLMRDVSIRSCLFPEVIISDCVWCIIFMYNNSIVVQLAFLFRISLLLLELVILARKCTDFLIEISSCNKLKLTIFIIFIYFFNAFCCFLCLNLALRKLLRLQKLYFYRSIVRLNTE